MSMTVGGEGVVVVVTVDWRGIAVAVFLRLFELCGLRGGRLV